MTDNGAIDPRASVGEVHLTVGDLPAMLHFYREVLGFRHARTEGDHTVYLSADGLYPFHLGLTGVPGAVRPTSRHTGLYHAAWLLPTRRALARILVRLLSQEVALDGASDHRVSEALYLRDPEGNGIELYADRPRDRWPIRDGQIRMTGEPLDVASLAAEVNTGDEEWSGIDPGTTVGHVHLRVSDLGRADAFYHGVIGFDVTLRADPAALFLSAGGYHHHLGVNVWAGVGLTPLPPGTTGLRYFTVAVPDTRELVRIARRAERRGVRIDGAVDHGVSTSVMLRDDDGIGVALTVDREPGRVPADHWTSDPRDVGAVLRG